VFSCRLHHAPALDDIVRDRLLDVDVLAVLTGPDGGQRVPVVWRGDYQGVDVFHFQQLADVLLDLWRLLLPGLDGLGRGSDDGVVDLAQLGDLAVLLGGKAGGDHQEYGDHHQGKAGHPSCQPVYDAILHCATPHHIHPYGMLVLYTRQENTAASRTSRCEDMQEFDSLIGAH